MAETMPNPEQNQNDAGSNEWAELKDVEFAGDNKPAANSKIEDVDKARHMAEVTDRDETTVANYSNLADALFNGNLDDFSPKPGSQFLEDIDKYKRMKREEQLQEAARLRSVAENIVRRTDRKAEEAARDYDDHTAFMQKMRER